MTVSDFIKEKQLNNTILIGYYGGGNFGDELLLETLLNLFKNNNISEISVFFLAYINYGDYHKKFDGYRIITNKFKFLAQLFKVKNIIIGGGGIWGLDFNRNVLILSLIVFFSKYILRKNVFLLGVGYYNSTSKLGRFAGYLVGISSDMIIARDNETFINFSRASRKVSLDRDIVFNTTEVNGDLYEEDVKELENKMGVSKKSVFITIRRFSGNKYDRFKKEVLKLIENNREKNIVLALLETKVIDRDDYEFLLDVSKLYTNVTILDFDYNPMALLFLFKRHSGNIVVISPQFHGQIIAYLTQTQFLPITYDNKNSELFKLIGIKEFFDIKDISCSDMQKFIDQFYE